MFKEGQVYVIRIFLCITNFFKYKTNTLCYMIKFKHDTAVKEYKRINFPKIMFHFKSFECILSKQGIDEKVLFDVIGRIVEVYSPMEKVIGGKQTRLIDFVLEDVR
nr:replication protein A 70 kDa DNA-binding subunit B-like [Ipomoea batatas]